MNDLQTLNSPHRNFESIKKIDEFGVEYFDSVVIEKAKVACKNSD